jgi:long-chain acyl-CoA synthetase
MRGYWNNPEENTLAFRNGLFRTGDIGYRDADGIPAVREVTVFGIPDLQWGELVMACVV